MDPITNFLFESNQSNIRLEKFDQKYFDSLPEDKHWLHLLLNVRGIKMFTIYFDKKKIGISGCRISDKDKSHGFFLIYIENDFRGKGLLCPIANKVFHILKLKTMTSTVEKKNIPSVKSHMNSPCFKPIDTKREKELIQKGYLSNTEIRFKYVTL